MRTEVKLALVVATAMIAGGIYWASRQVGSGKSPSEIPMDAKKIEKNAQDAAAKKPPATPAGPQRQTPARPTPSPATTNQPAPSGAPSATHRDAPPPQNTQPKPPADAPRLPPLASDPRGTSAEPSRPTTPLSSAPPATTRPAAAEPPFLSSSSQPSISRPPPSGTPGSPATDKPADRREPGVATPPLKEPAPRTDDINTRLQPLDKPAPAGAAKPAATPGGGSKTYAVQEGDTLSAIAREQLGDENLWPRIAAANPGVNPDLLKVGQTLTIPEKGAPAKPAASDAAKPAPPRNGETAKAPGTPPPSGVAAPPARPDAAKPDAPPKAGGATYVVGRGDTLRSIARNVLKDGGKWRQIYELNKDKLQSPDVIPEGVELRLPPVNGAAKLPPDSGKTGNGAAKSSKPASKPSSPAGGARR
ncbi:LysM domain/BON superfamily protein [Phycisphaerae bacterium RAS1]|nr:LysM domain/BON superfamily protein [Phycisphaerae bacterium RAS1]